MNSGLGARGKQTARDYSKSRLVFDKSQPVAIRGQFSSLQRYQLTGVRGSLRPFKPAKLATWYFEFVSLTTTRFTGLFSTGSFVSSDLKHILYACCTRVKCVFYCSSTMPTAQLSLIRVPFLNLSSSSPSNPGNT